MLGIFKKLFGTKYERDIKAYTPIVNTINEHFQSYSALSNDELRNKTIDFRDRIQKHLQEIDNEIADFVNESETTEDLERKEALFSEIDTLKEERDQELEVILKEILPEAFAVVKEAARRFSQDGDLKVSATEHDRNIAARPGKDYVRIDGEDAYWKNEWTAAGGPIQWNMVHYDVQLIGGMVLHDGKIAEMATGEGKTLVATLPAYLNGLSGKGVHVITVNDYLAKRDCEWVGPLFEFLHLTIDCIDKYRPHSLERRAAYECDITYGTNNEFGFDYLRDNMASSIVDKVQGKHHFSMIDEVDSVFIDDARTPLIISGPVPQNNEIEEYVNLRSSIERLIAAQKKLSNTYLTEAKKLFKEGKTGYEEGEMGMALLRAYRADPKYRPFIKFISTEGVKVLLQKAENYYMQEQSKNMHLVDEPLLYTIDEKNRNVDLTEAGTEFLSKGNEDTSFFVLPDIASTMVEIEKDDSLSSAEKAEKNMQLSQDYNLKARRLHAVNQLIKAYTLFDKDKDYVVMEGDVKIVDEQTGRIMDGRRYSDGLHQALEAKENVKVGNITQTYATITLQNYFRMYHKLAGMTGTAETEASEFWEIYKLDVVVIPTNKPIARADNEDLVFKTEREKINAVIDQVVQLTDAGRPVLVGTTSVDISERLSRMLNLRKIKHNVLNAKQHQREAEIVAEAGNPGKVTIATNMAGRGTDIKLSDQVKSDGGLAIIGTERHDSRRVDRQLRGRSGRQGDPGSSQFYISLEDDLMRKFGSERLASIMDRLGHQEGETLQHSMVTKSIEKAQKKVEENNFGIRKRLLEYDDVMNIQRDAIYTKRNNALEGQRLQVDLNNMFKSLTDDIIARHQQAGNYQDFKMDSIAILGVDTQISEEVFNNAPLEELQNVYFENFRQFYDSKEAMIKEYVYPIAKNVYENQGHQFKRIAIPFHDGGSNKLHVSADLESAVKTEGKSIMRDIEKTITLSIIDNKWKEHLRAMDELKESSSAASFEQKDPLVIYKMGAYRLFEDLIYSINEEVTASLAKGTIEIANQTVQEAKERRTDLSKTSTNKSEEALRRRAAEGVSQKSKPSTFKRTEEKIGRNSPCPCGSGKKYKQCHGK